MTNENPTPFQEMGLSPEILNALSDIGFEKPTPIQSEAIPNILSGSHDLLAFAQTGTGKTAAFSLPILEQIDLNKKNVQAIVLCPTRELCMQITKDIRSFSKYLPQVKTVAIYGGSSMRQQLQELEAGAQIVVGTPGRVNDLVNRRKLRLNKIQFLVLDEADDMLDKGFKEEMDMIIDETPTSKQTLLFSATMSPWIQKVAQQRMNKPHEIRIANQNQGSDDVVHKYVTVHAKDRYEALRRLLDVNPDVYGIVFCRTRRDTKEVAAKLIADNYSAQAIHGDITQDERSETMARFRKGEIQILVATDVAARGIDVSELTHVINYELPDSPETYIHRSGRTGRAGKTGISLTIINMREHGKLKRIEKLMRKSFSQVGVPTGDDICKAQLLSLVHKIKNTEVDTKNLSQYLPQIYEELQGLGYDELIQRFVSVEFNRFLNHYSNIKDISTQSTGDRGDSGRTGKKKRDTSKISFRSYRLNFGKKDGFNPKALFVMLNKNQSLRGIEIGGISVQQKFTEFEADAKYHEKVLRFLGMESYRNKPVRISAA